MCFIIAIVGLVFSFNFFMADNLLGSVGSFIVALFFIFLMIRNIKQVKKIKKERREKE